MSIRRLVNAPLALKLTTEGTTSKLTLGGNDGTIVVTIKSADTAGLSEGNVDPPNHLISRRSVTKEPIQAVYRYDLERIDADGLVTRVRQGRLFLRAEITE